MAKYLFAVCVIIAGSEFAPVRAQYIIGPGYPHVPVYSSGYSYSYRSGFGFSLGTPGFRVSGYSGGFVTRAAFVAPPIAVLPVAPFGFSPAFWRAWNCPAPVYFGPVWNPYGFTPHVVVVPQPVPVIVGANFNAPNTDDVFPPRDDRVVFPRGKSENDFIVFAPQKNTIPEITRIASAPKPQGTVIPFDPFREAVKVKLDEPDANPKKEAARLVAIARIAFAKGDYGRAAEHLERAITANADDAATYFYLAQAKFAAGQYADAVTRIRDGLTRDAKWPASAFTALELYAGNADRFATHLAALKQAVADNPEQPMLEFLLGYQLWFSGDKAEAAKLFRTAEKRLAAPGPIALFK